MLRLKQGLWADLLRGCFIFGVWYGMALQQDTKQLTSRE